MAVHNLINTENDAAKRAAQSLRKLANRIEEGEFGQLEYGLLLLQPLNVPPRYFGYGSESAFRRDRVIGAMFMAQSKIAVDDCIEPI